MDPALWNIYQNSGLTPGGQGQGFADWQYWQNVGPSQYGRLAADIAGTGRDQPTGTPGSGAWSTSGQGAPGQANFDSGYANAPAGGLGTIGGAAVGSGLGSLTGYDFLNKAPVPYAQTAQDKTLFDTLMGRAGQSLNVDPNDPIIKGQVDAFEAAQNRSRQNYLQGQAESEGAYGNPTSERRASAEKVGQATGQFQGTLMQNELNARRAEIQQALTEQGSLLSQQDQLALQRELGLINSQLGAQQIGNTFNLGQQQINSNNDQFAANYGANSTDRANYWDAVRSGLV
jgi:hypothetical protein